MNNSIMFDIGANTSGFDAGLARVRSGLGTVESGLGKIASLAAGAFAGFTIGKGVTESAKAFLDYETQLANIGTLIDGNKDRMNELNDAMKQTAAGTGEALGVVADATYQAISAFGDSADIASLVEEAAQAAKAGVASTAEAIDFAAANIKAFGMDLEDAGGIFDVAFQTVKDGQTTFAELATSMQKVLPIASSLGVGVEELYASVATLTGVTGSTAEVTTQLRAAFQAILAPNDKMSAALGDSVTQMINLGKITGEQADNFKKLQDEIETTTKKLNENKTEIQNLESLRGTPQWDPAYEDRIEALKKQNKEFEKSLEDTNKAMSDMIGTFADDLLGEHGIQGVLEIITEAAGGNNTLLREMFGSVEALTGVLALTGAQADTFSAKLERMGTAAGATNEAFDVQAETISFSLEKLKSNFENFKVDLGESFANMALPFMEKGIEVLQGFTDNLKNFSESVKNFMADPIAGIKEFTAEVPSIGIAVDELVEGVNKLKEGNLLEGLDMVFNATIDVLIGGVEFLGEKISGGVQQLADKAREQLGWPADKDSGLKLDDLKAIATLAFEITKKALGAVGNGIDTLADYARSFLGWPTDGDGFNLGDLAAFAGVAFEITKKTFGLVGSGVNSIADYARAELGWPDDAQDGFKLGDLKAIAALAFDFVAGALTAAGEKINSLADMARKHLGWPADDSKEFKLGDIKAFAGLAFEFLEDATKAAGTALDSLADLARKKLGWPADADNELTLGDVKAFANLAWEELKLAGEKIGNFGDWIADQARKAMGWEVDADQEFTLGDIKAVGNLIWNNLTWAAGKIGEFGSWIADQARVAMGWEPTADKEFNLGDVHAVANLVWENLKLVGNKINDFGAWVVTEARAKLGWEESESAWPIGAVKTIAELAWKGLEYTGKALGNFADWIADEAREELGWEQDNDKKFTLGDVKAIANLAWKGLELVGEKIGEFASWIADEARKELGWQDQIGDKAFTIGDVKAIANLAWKGLELVGEKLGNAADWVADEARKELGWEVDEDKEFNIGDVKAIGSLVWNKLQYAGEKIGVFADWVADQAREAMGWPPDADEEVTLGDVKAVASLVWNKLQYAGEVITNFGMWAIGEARTALGWPEETSESLIIGTVKFAAKMIWETLKYTGQKITNFVEWATEKGRIELGWPADTEESIPIGAVKVFAALTWEKLQWAGGKIADFATWVTAEAKLSLGWVDSALTYSIGAVKAAADLTWESFNWIGKKVEDFGNWVADEARKELGWPADTSKEFNIGDVKAIAYLTWKGLEKVGEAVGSFLSWIGGEARKLLGWADRGADNPVVIGDVAAIASLVWKGLKQAKETAISTGANILTWLGDEARKELGWPEIPAEGLAVDTVRAVAYISAFAFEKAVDLISAAGDFIGDRAREALGMEFDENGNLDLGDIKAVATLGWEKFKNAAEVYGDMKKALDDLIAEQSGSGAAGSLASTAVFSIPIAFAVTQGQRSIADLLSGVGGLGAGLQVLGGKILNAAGTAALSMGITIFLSDATSGNLGEGALKQAIAGAMGIGVGLLTGSAAAGTLTYGVTVMVQTILDDMIPADAMFGQLENRIEGLKDTLGKTMPFGVTQEEKTKIIKDWESIHKSLQSLQSKHNWEQILTPDQKQIVEYAEQLYQVLGEELKNAPADLDFSGTLDLLLDSLSSLGKELQDDVLAPEGGLTLMASFQVDSESEKALNSFRDKMNELPTQKTVEILVADNTAGGVSSVNGSLMNVPSYKTITVEVDRGNLDALQADVASMQNLQIPMFVQLNFSKPQLADDGFFGTGALQGTLGLTPETNTTVNVGADTSEAQKTIEALDGQEINLDVNFNFEPFDPSKIGIGTGDGYTTGGYTPQVGTYTPAGIVHGGEWVAPSWMVRDDRYAEVISVLENARSRGYASGGYVGWGGSQRDQDPSRRPLEHTGNLQYNVMIGNVQVWGSDKAQLNRMAEQINWAIAHSPYDAEYFLQDQNRISPYAQRKMAWERRGAR